jgi:hypothetical protein
MPARFISILCIAGALAACERTKSENPLSPTIAGPLPNVSMTPPQPIEPYNGKTIIDTEQPIVLLMTNPTSSSPRAFAVDVQIATDPQFSNLIVTRTGVAPGDDGKTRLPLGDRLPAGRPYYWRALANDGANVSGWSEQAFFTVTLPVVLGPPEPREPVANSRVASSTPEFRVMNGAASGPYTQLFVQFQVSASPNFVPLFTNAEVPAGDGETRYTMPSLPTPDTIFYWRARKYDAKNLGPWSHVESFRSPATPTPGPPGPGPGPGGPVSCASSNGDVIAQCVAGKYPERLAAGVSSGERRANMEFLRDRMIEAGLCGGMDLGWNLKRGGPEISVDFLVWRRGDGDVGIDIGAAYDDTSQPLRLQWSESTFPYYLAYPRPNCG